MRLFVLGFLEQERGERERENFCLNFLRLFFQNFLTFFTFSLYFSIFFLTFSSYFSQKLGGGGGGGGVYRSGEKIGGQHQCIRIHQCQLPVMLASHFCHLISLFSSFFDFWPDLRAAVWRPFRFLFSSNFICTDSS